MAQWKLFMMKACFVFSFLMVPQATSAGFFSFFSEMLNSAKAQPAAVDRSVNSQNIPLLQANLNPDPEYGKGGGDITVVNGNALLAESGPMGTLGTIEERSQQSSRISLYTVRENDTLSQIAKMYEVSVNTIVWANDLKGKSITPGQTLVILPVTGLIHKVKAGDTIASIAKKYKADITEIAQFNGLEEGAKLAVGTEITVPEAELPSVANVIPEKNYKQFKAHDTNGPEYDDYYLRPTTGTKTQGLHGYNGIDIGAPSGTPIYASAAGDVIVARSGGWNGGYGNYVVITHPNGTQTLYGHMSKIIIAPGERVYRGQIIGYVGSTGRSTGPHLHFEVRGARNPF